MKRPVRHVAVAALAACATFGVTLGTATAHKVKHVTGTALEYLPPEPEFPTHDFVGVIVSKKGTCEPRRKVVLLYNGDPVARGRSMRVPEIDGGRDAWYGWLTRADDPPPAGTYRAKVQPRPLKRTARHRHICTGTRSNPVTLGESDSVARARSADSPGGLFFSSDLTRLR